jgi:hypothetical protein
MVSKDGLPALEVELVLVDKIALSGFSMESKVQRILLFVLRPAIDFGLRTSLLPSLVGMSESESLHLPSAFPLAACCGHYFLKADKSRF